jgi:hypothetical protein
LVNFENLKRRTVVGTRPKAQKQAGGLGILECQVLLTIDSNPTSSLTVLFALSVLLSLSNLALSVEGEGQTYLDGGVNVSGGNHFKDSPLIFVHGDTAQFNGWTDSHRDGHYNVANTSNATFTVDIIGPSKQVIYHTLAITDETGNAYFSIPISSSFEFGTYTISYSLEKEGFIGVTPNAGSDVSYYESRFFVTWTEDDVVDRSDTYKLELLAPPSDNLQFGSSIDIQGKLCPSPVIRPEPHEASYDSRTGSVIFEETNSPIIIGQFSPSGNNSESNTSLASRNITALLSLNICDKPFTLTSGVLGVSGTWSVTADAYWMVDNDTMHVYHTETSKTLTFEIPEAQYRSDNIVTIRLDPEYNGTTAMDWSLDGKSILFRYWDESQSRNKLGILDLTSRNVTQLDPLSGLSSHVGEEGSINDAKFSTLDTIVLGSNGKLYSYDLHERNLQKIVDSGPIWFFDVNPDGPLLYNLNGSLLMADIDGKNPKVIMKPNEQANPGYGDLSPDGKKLLYRKILDASYGWSAAVLAYYDIETKQETVIPNITNGCGYPPRWAPNGYHLVYHESSCSRGWPGAILRITDIHGSFQEFIVPGSNDYPNPFIFNPGGNSLLIGFASSGTIGGAAESMGGPADFYIMTLATPVPEFSPSVLLLVFSSSLVVILLALRRLSWNQNRARQRIDHDNSKCIND